MTILKTTWHHIRRSPFQSMVAIIAMIACFFAISFYAIISDGLSTVIKYFETKPEVTIFLKDGLDTNAIQTIQKDLASYPNVKETKYISKEKALSIYKEQNKDNPMLTEMVTASILPASFEIIVSDPKVLEQIYQNYSSKTNIVDEVIYQKDVIKSLLEWTEIIKRIGISIALIIGSISFLTVFTIIGMKVTNRKEEIRISRLLGASAFYVKKPFLLEGMIYGVTGALVGSLLSFIIITILRSKINSFFDPIIFITNKPSFYLLVLSSEILLGLILGFVASWIGARRYIKF
ncbi:MAG: permease-like cell division protein FtsX [Candidatus Shapirobacteria bacterium]